MNFFMQSAHELISTRKQSKEDASDLIEQKAGLEKEKKAAEEIASQKENQRDRMIRTIGNYVHESVPVSNNEVSLIAVCQNKSALPY